MDTKTIIREDNLVTLDIPEPYLVLDEGGYLFNINTKKPEGLEGDLFTVIRDGNEINGIVEGYANYQLIKPKGQDGMVLPANDARNNVTYQHNYRWRYLEK